MARGDSFSGNSTTAPITNVALCIRAVERAISRPDHLPGLVGFYGPSGFGKSVGAAYAASRFRAYYVEAKSTWTAKKLLQAILAEMGIKPASTIYDMADQAAEQLAAAQNHDQPRPLIIDEVDHLVEKRVINIVRDLHDASGGAPILLIGEENLEIKLRAWERIHNRILEWVPAQPSSLADTRKLAEMYGRGTKIADDLLGRLHSESRGITRRICVNLERVVEYATLEGITEPVTLARWGAREFYTGEARRAPR